MPFEECLRQCRPEFDHVLFGINQEAIVRGDSEDLPPGWERLRRRHTGRNTRSPDYRQNDYQITIHDRLTTSVLDWWRWWAELRAGVVDDLHDALLPYRSDYGPDRRSVPPTWLQPIAPDLLAEYFEQQVFLTSSDWNTYAFNIWLIVTRLLQPEILRSIETGSELDLFNPAIARGRDGSYVFPDTDFATNRPCPRASAFACIHLNRLRPHLYRLAHCILRYQRSNELKRQSARREGRPSEPTPYACIGARGRELPPTPPIVGVIDWEVAPQFFPEDATGRAERVAFNQAIVNHDLVGPFSLLPQYPRGEPHEPYPGRPFGPFGQDPVTSPLLRHQDHCCSLASSKLRRTVPRSNFRPVLGSLRSFRWLGTYHQVLDSGTPGLQDSRDQETPIRLKEIIADSVVTVHRASCSLPLLVEVFGEVIVAQRVVELGRDLTRLHREEEARARRQGR